MSKRKTIITNVLLVIVILSVWFILPRKAAPIDIPPIDDTISIEVIKIGGGKADILDMNQIETVMNHLISAEPTRTRAVNDQPTNVEAFGTININTGDVVWVLYYYEKNGKHYIEQPYRGVYELKESFEKHLPTE